MPMPLLLPAWPNASPLSLRITRLYLGGSGSPDGCSSMAWFSFLGRDHFHGL